MATSTQSPGDSKKQREDLAQALFDINFYGDIPMDGLNINAMRQIADHILTHYTSNEKIRAAFDKLETKGHGGGNWRRLITLAREDLGLDEPQTVNVKIAERQVNPLPKNVEPLRVESNGDGGEGV